MGILKNIFDDCGLNIQRYEQVNGGDINNAYCLFTSTGKYFLKINDKSSYPAMFEKEARGLELLHRNSELKIPKVIKAGECNDRQYLLLEWLEKGSPQKSLWQNFGEALAKMHQQPQEYFGLNEDNYIGSLQQKNDRRDQWHLFYIECRLMSLIKTLFDEGAYTLKDIKTANSFCNKLESLFPVGPPSLLHGDLWAGNYLISASGDAAIYDPAVYYGHREMDIGMTKLFGGFEQRFYNSYNEIYPLEKDWENRLQLTQLYPLLVHAVLFGGHYIAATKNIFASF